LTLDELLEQVARWQDFDRIIFDAHAHTYLTPERTALLMEHADRAVYFVPSNAADSAIRRLQAIDVAGRGWRDKVSVAWLITDESPVVPAVPNLADLAARDFKIHETPPKSPSGRSVAFGLERLVHDVRGVRVGVALGGGASRGLANLGVLKALERCGIVLDMVAGTSAGAMTGIMYSAGLDPDYNTEVFATVLQPPWVFRHLRHGNYWHLLYRFRRGHFDAMLRKYLHDWRLEQLPVPCLSVTVDLVSGNSVVRERGDAVQAILESINLPLLSVPIVREGQALIDGGLVNNIPADVLVSKGCNFVIAVSVTSKLEARFCDISANGQTRSRTKPGTMPTIVRSLLVQNYNLNSFGVQPADLVIEPDVSSIDPAEFHRAKELAAIGEAAALEQIPKIRRLLNRLDPQLFKPTSDTLESAPA
jgi:predicted acylesterase/phospholipase RssA